MKMITPKVEFIDYFRELTIQKLKQSIGELYLPLVACDTVSNYKIPERAITIFLQDANDESFCLVIDSEEKILEKLRSDDFLKSFSLLLRPIDSYEDARKLLPNHIRFVLKFELVMIDSSESTLGIINVYTIFGMP